MKPFYIAKILHGYLGVCIAPYPAFNSIKKIINAVDSFVL